MGSAKEEKRPLATTGEATIDVDAMWKRLNSTSISNPKAGAMPIVTVVNDNSNGWNADGSNTDAAKGTESKETLHEEDMVTIKHTYEFAGEMIVGEKLVPRSSYEAEQYLKSLKPKIDKTGPEGQVLFRPLRRRSKWDPNPEAVVAGVASSKETLWQNQNAVAKTKTAEQKASKLNVVDKSKMDWRELVQKEGRRDELDQAAKAKDAYHSRVAFLERVEDTREEELRIARKK